MHFRTEKGVTDYLGSWRKLHRGDVLAGFRGMSRRFQADREEAKAIMAKGERACVFGNYYQSRGDEARDVVLPYPIYQKITPIQPSSLVGVGVQVE